MVEILNLMLGRDSDEEIRSRFVEELVTWPKEFTLVNRAQPSVPFCLWQHFKDNQPITPPLCLAFMILLRLRFCQSQSFKRPYKLSE